MTRTLLRHIVTPEPRVVVPRACHPLRSGLSRRALLRSAVGGAASLVAGQLLPARAASAPGVGDQGTIDSPEIRLSNARVHADTGPPSLGPLVSPPPGMNREARAMGGLGRATLGTGVQVISNASGGGNLANITSVLSGPGLYIGNEFENWIDAKRQQVFHQIASWGFEWVCPKVGGYGATWYSSDQQLRNWRTWANQAGLAFAPFIYCIPSTAVRDAQISSEIASDCGIVVVDMEDEWASSTGAYNGQMATFGATYRGLNPNTPIIVTGYGDPTYAFAGWPYSQMAAWADGYSPQWYYGEWNTYGGLTADVTAAVNWGDGYCSSAFGSSFPLIPSVSVYSAYSTGIVEGGNRYLPNSDIIVGANYTRLWKAPVIWWEYGGMTASRAAACLA